MLRPADGELGPGRRARPLIERFVRIFGGHEHVECPSGSCASMVRIPYRQLIGEQAPPELRAGLDRLAGSTHELCEFLIEVMKLPRASGRFAHKVGLHHSCHGLRELRLGSVTERRIPRSTSSAACFPGWTGSSW